MKKHFLLIALIAVTSQTTFSQDKSDIEVSVGIGFNLSTFYGSDTSQFDTSSRTSFQGGVTAEYFFNRRWGIKSGFIYDSKGAELVGSGELNLDYLFIPIYANWHFGRNKNWYLNFGPHINFLLKAEDQDNNDVQDIIRTVDIGLGVGVGYKFEISKGTKLYIEYQGAGGFLDVIDTTGNNPNFKNTRSALNFGINVDY